MLTRTTATETAAVRIREWILSGALAGSQHLNQDEIAASLGVSRVPIREAFRRLESEGLITITPHRGAIVAPLSIQDVEDIYSVRIPVEGAAAELGVPNLDDQDRAKMEQMLNLMGRSNRDLRRAEWFDLDREFHFTIYRACQRPRLIGVVSNFWDLALRYRRMYQALPHVPERTHDTHRELLDACRRFDQDAAKQIVADAAQEARDTIVDHLRSHSFAERGPGPAKGAFDRARGTGPEIPV
jgi:DNA-binding GntR family transcriptional regulator